MKSRVICVKDHVVLCAGVFLILSRLKSLNLWLESDLSANHVTAHIWQTHLFNNQKSTFFFNISKLSPLYKLMSNMSKSLHFCFRVCILRHLFTILMNAIKITLIMSSLRWACAACVLHGKNVRKKMKWRLTLGRRRPEAGGFRQCNNTRWIITKTCIWSAIHQLFFKSNWSVNLRYGSTCCAPFSFIL